MRENKLSRKEKVLLCLETLTEEHVQLYNNVQFGFDAEFISKKITINRSNASKELNKLLKEELVVKIKGKPVQYLHKQIIETNLGKKINGFIFENVNELIYSFKSEAEKDKIISEENAGKHDEFNIIGANGSLRQAIEKAKAAVIYPPNGLSTLIIGPTGVGKSIFAECMYKYSLSNKGRPEETPFIIFNCADYSDNQHLLLSQLFGYVKGAFTGADKEKYGLVHEANNGILFLDEVHRLSAEGQEMLFLLMDKGVYRRLGETNKVHECKIMIIAATTENPQEAMLETFLRRIPVIIKIPALDERGITERMKLICRFFKDESRRIGVALNVSKEVIKAFILYECKGNIGQLKSDVQLICARAFLDYMTYKREKIFIKLSLLSNNIREGLYLSKKREDIINNFNLIGKEDITFFPDDDEFSEQVLLVENSKYDLDFYGIIKETWKQLHDKGVADGEIREIIDKDIQKYSYNLMNIFVYNSSDQTVYDKLVNESIANIVKNILMKYNSWNKKEGLDKLIRAIALHIQNLIERIKGGNIVSNQSRKDIIKERLYEYKIAKEILQSVSILYDIDFPVDEEIFLATFLYMTNLNKYEENVAILVIMHGESTASSMAKVANNLLDCNQAVSINMDLKDKVQDILLKAINIAPNINKGKGILILTDMGSILSFAKVIEDGTGIPVRAIDMVSTPIVIEATRKSLSPDMDLEMLYTFIIETTKEHYLTAKVNTLEKNDKKRYFDTLLINNISKTLTFLNAEKAFIVLKQVINNISNYYGLSVDDDMLVKFIFHCCCMIERAIVKDYLPYKSYEERINRSKNLYSTIKKHFGIVEETFAINISDIEYANILDIFESQYGTDVFNF